MKSRQTTNYLLPKNRGFGLLLIVIVVGAMGTVLAFSLGATGSMALKTSKVFEKGVEARGLAQACAEIALQEIRDSDSFSGSGNLTIGSGTCTYAVTDTGGNSREITSSGIIDDVTRKTRVLIDGINPHINVLSWKEVADY
jgi:hypothetical protein